MKVKTRLQLSAALPILLAVITAIILYRITAHVEDIIPKLRAANGIAREAARLDQATFMYLLSPNDETRLACYDAHKGLNDFLVEQPYLSGQDQKILEALQLKHAETTAIFRKLDDHMKSLTASGATANDVATREMLRQILSRTRTTVVEAQTLAANAHDGAVTLQERAYFFIISAATILAGILALLSLMLIGRVTGGVHALKDGMAEVAADNVSHRLSTDGDDEIADLNVGFNRMTEEIGTVRKHLKDEIAEKEQVAQSLRATNVELSAALEKLKRAQADALHRERSDALRQISRGIVHDLNDALMPVKGLSDLYLNYPDQLKDTKEVQEAFGSVHGAAERISKIVQNIASFCAPTRKIGKTKIELSNLVQEVIAATEPLWKAQKQMEGITIAVKTELTTVPAFDADRADLVDAVRSLITNAIEAMPTGGTVTIRTKLSGKTAIVEVTDIGEGMDEQLRARALEPFFSTKGDGHSGMGLTSVQGALTRMAGQFRLESTPGRGTTAIMTIPMETSTAIAEDGPVVPVLNRKLQILTVDDEPWSTKVLSRHLSVDGHQTDSCATGQATLAVLKQRSVDLVIIDRAMPDMSGDILAQEIKKLHPKLPVLMLTGFGGLMVDDLALPKGVDRVLPKPVDLKDLRAAIAAIFAS